MPTESLYLLAPVFPGVPVEFLNFLQRWLAGVAGDVGVLGAVSDELRERLGQLLLGHARVLQRSGQADLGTQRCESVDERGDGPVGTVEAKACR